MHSLSRQEIFLLVLDFGGIVQRRVHIAVAVRIRNALHGASCCLPKSDGGRHSLDCDQLQRLPCLCIFFCLLTVGGVFFFFFHIPLLYLAFNQPEKKAGERCRQAQ